MSFHSHHPWSRECPEPFGEITSFRAGDREAVTAAAAVTDSRIKATNSPSRGKRFQIHAVAVTEIRAAPEHVVDSVSI